MGDECVNINGGAWSTVKYCTLKTISEMLMAAGAALLVIGFGLTQVNIPLSESEANALFDKCIECKSPPTHRNIDPNVTLSLLVAGIPVISAGLILKLLHKNTHVQETKQ